LKGPEPTNVRPYNQNQMDLFPPNVRSLIADDHLCLVVNDVVTALDLSCLYIKVSPEGNRPYHPAMMVKVLFYAYARGIFSSRKIAEALKENIGFIFLAAWQKPDFRTISDFRKNNLNELGLLFAQIVLLCSELGMVKLGHVSIDGTKIKANASDAKTYDDRRIEREIAHAFGVAGSSARCRSKRRRTIRSGQNRQRDPARDPQSKAAACAAQAA